MNFGWLGPHRGSTARDRSTCGGCGSALDELTQEQISQAVEEVLEETRPQIKPLPGVCPLCGHSSAVPVSHRKSIQFGLLLVVIVIASALAIAYYTQRNTERQQVAVAALRQLHSNADAIRYLGAPVTVSGTITGQVKQDETGWQEARLTVPVRGPQAEGILRIVGGRSTGAWTFTTLDVVIATQRKRVDLVAGRIIDSDPDGYVDVHTEVAVSAEYLRTTVPPARWGGDFRCVSTSARAGSGPWIGTCATPGPIAALKSSPVDRFDVDLRFGKFILRQTDLLLKDGDLHVPLTRTYASQFWVHRSRVHAFGRNSTHDFDLGLIGSRNPYTYLKVVVPDGDSLYLPRISRGGGYADAVYQHSETSSGFYKAIIRWDGKGWEARLDDGAIVDFPESYNARNRAQGAPTRMTDANGNTLQLIRDRSRNLLEVRAARGHSIKFAYDDQARIVRAENDAGDWVQYHYGGDAELTDVIFSDGRARRYTYVGELLTWVRDETGRALIHNWYRDWKVVRQDYADGTSYEFRYTMAPNNRYVEEATVVFPEGATRSFRTADMVSQSIKDLK